MPKIISIFCDGGARGNPGPAAIAFVVIQEGKVIHQSAEKIGRATNNVAEYQAVIAALEWLKNNQTNFQFLPRSGVPLRGTISNFQFYLDSQLVVNQLNGDYKIKDAKLRPLTIKVKALEQEIGAKIFYCGATNFVYHYVPRFKNKMADALVKKTLSV